MNWLLKFEEQLRLQGYAQRTIKAYTSAMRSYSRWLNAAPPQILDRQEVAQYLQHCIAQGRSRSHVDLSLSALRFWYEDMCQCPPSSLAGLRPTRPPRANPAPTPPEIWRIADGIPIRSHRLAVLLMYASGLQLKQVVALTVGDVDCSQGTVRVVEPDSGQVRYVILHREVHADVSRLCQNRPAEAPLLVGTGGRAVSTHTVRRAYQKSVQLNGLRRFDSLTMLRGGRRALLQRASEEQGSTVATTR